LTGGSGFLGSHVADALLHAGYGVRVAVRATSSLRWLADKSLETVVVDLADTAACAAFLTGTAGVVHCAGVVSAPDAAGYREGNVQPTLNLLAAAAQVWAESPTATFLLVSSLAAHGPASLDQPAVETNPCRPLTAYGRSKRDAEKALLAAPGPFRRLVLRPPSLYGPRDREFLPLLKAATSGWTVRLGRRLTGLSLVDGRDAAAAAVALLQTSTAAGIYFVADAQGGYDWQQLQEALSRATGRTIRRVEVPLSAVRLAAGITAMLGGLLGREASLLLNPDRVRDLDSIGWVCDGSRLVSDTDFRPRFDAATGFGETLTFYRKQGWL
jgi:nucleoside-diphosphate-sugar epimerase